MPRRRVDVNDYDRTKNGRGEHVREHSRMQDVRGDAKPSMNSLRREKTSSLQPVVIGGVTIPNVMLPEDAKWTEGEYTTGFGFNPPPPSQAERYIDTDKVVIDGKLFDETTEFMWQDPDWMTSLDQDYPDADYVRRIAEGEIDEDKVAEETGLQQFYHFTAGGQPFGHGYRITGNGEVQIFPKDQPLGRIPLYEKDYSGNMRFVHDDELAWRKKGTVSYEGAY